MRRGVAIGLLTLCGWSSLASESLACSCAAPGAPCNGIARADAVFIGRVTGTSVGVQFDVERPVKGVGTGPISLGNGPPSCALPFNIGERYVVYAYRDPSTGSLYTGMCTRTRPLADPHTDGDLAYFDIGQDSGAARHLLTGVVRNDTIRLDSQRVSVPELAGIPVTLRPVDGGPALTSSTRANGSYQIAGMTPGRFVLTATLDARFEKPEPVTVFVPAETRCAEADIRVYMDGRIRGQVVDERGQPARGVGVDLADAVIARTVTTPFSTVKAVTDERGYFEFRRLGPGRYVLGVDLSGGVRPGKLDRRRFYGETQDPGRATIIELGMAERHEISPFKLVPLPVERTITISLQAALDEVAADTKLFMTGASRELVQHRDGSVTIRLPFGAAYVLEAVAPDGYRVAGARFVRIDRDDTDRTVEFRVEKQ